jgi:hypothetical protein
MLMVRSEADVRVLVALAQHCYVITGERDTFSPTLWLSTLIEVNHQMVGDELARAALFLSEEGAELNAATRQRFAERHPEAYQMYHEWTQEQVKEPGCA